MIWVLLGLAAVAVVSVLVISRRETVAADPLDHYRAQLDEITEDEARGIIDAPSAKAARLEVERRILKVAGTSGTRREKEAGDRRLPFVLATLVLAGSAALYAVMGSPHLEAQPGVIVAGRDRLVDEGGTTTYGEAIAAVQAHLKENPDDIQGLEILAKSARAVRDYSVSANAFARLVQLQPHEAAWRIQQFEAMMAMAGGQITPAAKMVLGSLLEAAPDHPAGQYYLGLTRLQAGDRDGAKAVWQALADRSAADAPWMPTLNDQLSKLGVRPPKLSQDQMAAVADMSEEDRRAFIASMMDRLANRLENAPDDPEGWVMLARSHLAMGDRETAISVLERGLAMVSEGNRAPIKALLDNLRANPDL